MTVEPANDGDDRHVRVERHLDRDCLFAELRHKKRTLESLFIKQLASRLFCAKKSRPERRPEFREETPKEAYAAIACCTAIMVRPSSWFNEKGR